MLPCYVLRGFSALEKNTVLPIRSCRYNSSLRTKMAIWRTFLKTWSCWVRWGSSLQSIMLFSALQIFKKCTEQPLPSAAGWKHPTRSLSRIVCREQKGPKCSKGTMQFFETQETRSCCKEIQVYLSLENFELMMSEHRKGRRALWWIRKG